MTTYASATGVTSASSHSSGPPSTVPGVVVSISGTLGVRYPAVNSGMDDSTVPSGRMTVDTPLVEEISTLRPCSTARTRLIACCWYVSFV